MATTVVTDHGDRPNKSAARTKRDKRLAEALRANLKRRKVAARQEKSRRSSTGKEPAGRS